MNRLITILILLTTLVACGRNSAEIDEEKKTFEKFLLEPFDGVAIRNITWNIPLKSSNYTGKADLRCFDLIKIDAANKKYVNIVSCYLLDKLHGPLMPEEASRYNQFTQGRIENIRYVTSEDSLHQGRIGNITFSLIAEDSSVPYRIEELLGEHVVQHDMEDFTYHYDTNAYAENVQKNVDTSYQFASLPEGKKGVLPSDQNSSGCYAESVKYYPVGRFQDVGNTPISARLYPQDGRLYRDGDGHLYRDRIRITDITNCNQMAHKFLGTPIDRDYNILEEVEPILDAELQTFLNACNFLTDLHSLKKDPEYSKGYFYVPIVNEGVHDYYFKQTR